MLGSGIEDAVWVRRLIAAAIVVLLSGFSASIPVFAGGFTPLMFILSVFIITLYAPEAMPSILLIILSLIYDAFIGTALGLTGFSCLVVLLFSQRMRRALVRQPTHVVWLTLAAMLGLQQIMVLAMLLALSQSYSLQSAFTSWAFTLVFIPLLQPILARVFRQA